MEKGCNYQNVLNEWQQSNPDGINHYDIYSFITC